MPVVRTIGHGTELVVFVPGMPGSHAMFHPVLEQVPNGTECIVMDLVDTGEAPDAPEATLDELEDDVAEVLAGQHGPVTAVGVSVGAYLIGRVLPKVADSVARVVLLGGMPYLTAARRRELAELADAIEGGTLDHNQLVAVACEQWLASETTDAAVHEVRTMLDAEPADRIVRALRRLSEVDAQRPVPPFEVPGLCLHTRGDPAVTFDLGEQLSALGSRCEMRPLDGDAHLLPLTRPQLLAEAVFHH
ncbi:MAG: alpha/beta fold hydrolase [Polyangiales bacterium]